MDLRPDYSFPWTRVARTRNRRCLQSAPSSIMSLNSGQVLGRRYEEGFLLRLGPGCGGGSFSLSQRPVF
ncbi:unnamed protein product [Linum tenue]|uniref:Uncharacterized protein n=1 Tax=Linum tenue TaxID=586396 RepID=A0AAV0GWT4_9ROSI|nr:unnamed protein product [Linum tenue]